MFPPFINSFGDQAFAVIINFMGSALGSLFTILFTAFTNSILNPMLKSIAAALGLPT